LRADDSIRLSIFDAFAGTLSISIAAASIVYIAFIYSPL